jgi:dolichyl-phosphate beta-glucosyltransferase
MKKERISVVIPVFNEEKKIARTIAEVSSCFSVNEDFVLAEIIAVDDGSSDATHSILLTCSEGNQYLRVLRHQQNEGKGAAVRTGVLEASGDLILFTDADLSTPLSEAGKLYQALIEDVDVAVGSRALKESMLLRRQPFYREISGRLFNLFVQVFFTWGIWDTQCGFKLFRALPGKRIFSLLRTKGFAFDVEFLYLAKAMGYAIREVPVSWVNDPDSKVKMLRDPVVMLRDLVRIRTQSARKKNMRASRVQRDKSPESAEIGFHDA